jgi:hypothetical protein
MDYRKQEWAFSANPRVRNSYNNNKPAQFVVADGNSITSSPSQRDEIAYCINMIT